MSTLLALLREGLREGKGGVEGGAGLWLELVLAPERERGRLVKACA